MFNKIILIINKNNLFIFKFIFLFYFLLLFTQITFIILPLHDLHCYSTFFAIITIYEDKYINLMIQNKF